MTIQISFKRNDWIFHTGPLILAICASVDVSKYLGILTGNFNDVCASSILTCVKADTASAACPEHPGSLDIVSMTFAAVIWDADDPCSVNTAYEPESSFTMSPRNTTPYLYIFDMEVFLRWQRCINDAKWPFLPFFLASTITSILFLTFVSCHARIFFSFCPFFLHCRFCIWIFECLKHRNEFVHKTVMSYRICPFLQWCDLDEVCVLLLQALVSCFRRPQQYRRIFLLRFPILRWVSPLLLIGILQRIAAGIGTSNFPRAAFIVSLNSSSLGLIKNIPLN